MNYKNKKQKYRIVHINHTLHSGDFFTIQYEDLSVKDFKDVQYIQEHLRNTFYEKPYTIGCIGDAYGEWTKGVVCSAEQWYIECYCYPDKPCNNCLQGK